MTRKLVGPRRSTDHASIAAHDRPRTQPPPDRPRGRPKRRSRRRYAPAGSTTLSLLTGPARESARRRCVPVRPPAARGDAPRRKHAGARPGAPRVPARRPRESMPTRSRVEPSGTKSASGCAPRSWSTTCGRFADFLRLTPAEGGWRVVVVDGADVMNRNAANALLKGLEEPPWPFEVSLRRPRSCPPGSKN